MVFQILDVALGAFLFICLETHRRSKDHTVLVQSRESENYTKNENVWNIYKLNMKWMAGLNVKFCPFSLDG